MSDAPPILVPPAVKNPFQTIARISWIAPLAGLALNFLLVIGSGGKSNLSNALLSLVFIGGGLLLGVIALFGIPKYGRKGILIPALIGIGIPVALVLLALPNVYAARQRARRHGPPEPAIHSPAARLLRNERLHFSMDVPQGFVEWHQGETGPNVEHCFVRELSDAGGARMVINIQRLNGVIPPRQPLRHEDVVKNTPPGAKMDLVQKNWRGFKVDTFVTEMPPQNGIQLVVYAVQIPLRPSAIQVNVGGPSSHRTEAERVTDEIVASVDGDTNW